MFIRDDETGIEITLGYDEDRFPVLSVHIPPCNYHDEWHRPLILVVIDGVTVHPLFSPDNRIDRRWLEERTPEPRVDPSLRLPPTQRQVHNAEFALGLLSYIEDGSVTEVRPVGFVEELRRVIAEGRLDKAKENPP